MASGHPVAGGGTPLCLARTTTLAPVSLAGQARLILLSQNTTPALCLPARVFACGKTIQSLRYSRGGHSHTVATCGVGHGEPATGGCVTPPLRIGYKHKAEYCHPERSEGSLVL